MDNYSSIEHKAANLIPFRGNTMRGAWDERDSGVYWVYSYNAVIGRADTLRGERIVYSEKWSKTTTRHQNILRRAWGVA